MSGPGASDGRILCAGRLYCDLVFEGAPGMPEPGIEVFASGLSLMPGGGAYITAAWAAALGRPATLFAVAPAAPFSSICLRGMAEAGVVDATVPAPPGRDPQITVAIPYRGDRAFLTRRPGAALPDAPLPDGARHLHIGELATLAERPEIVAEARGKGMTVSLDCAWDEVPPPAAETLIASVDVFLPNESEAARLQAGGVAFGAAITVVKHGAAGASSRGLRRRGPAVQGLDSTGAGDAFDAGWLDAWLSGASPQACLDAGNACGAAAVRGVGGTGGIPHLKQKEGVA